MICAYHLEALIGWTEAIAPCGQGITIRKIKASSMQQGLVPRAAFGSPWLRDHAVGVGIPSRASVRRRNTKARIGDAGCPRLTLRS